MRRSLVAGGVVVAALAASVAAFVIRSAQSADAPPGLSSDMVAAVDNHGWHVVPDQQATAGDSETAAQLADRYGPSSYSPHAVVMGVSLADTSHGPSDDSELMWVVYVEHVSSACFGPANSCPDEPQEGTEVTFVDPDDLETVRSVDF
jgi:hypothetical protein